jgi:hypothetical protein
MGTVEVRLRPFLISAHQVSLLPQQKIPTMSIGKAVGGVDVVPACATNESHVFHPVVVAVLAGACRMTF